MAQQAKIWWYENLERVCKKYNICGIDSSTDGGGKNVCYVGIYPYVLIQYRIAGRY